MKLLVLAGLLLILAGAAVAETNENTQNDTTLNASVNSSINASQNATTQEGNVTLVVTEKPRLATGGVITAGIVLAGLIAYWLIVKALG